MKENTIMDKLKDLGKFLSSLGSGWLRGGQASAPGSERGRNDFDRFLLIRLLIAALIFFLSFWLPLPDYAKLILILASLAVSGYDVAYGAVSALTTRNPFDGNLLLTAAVLVSIFIGYAYEAAAVMILFQFGGMCQYYAIRRTKQSVEELLDLSPDMKAAMDKATETKGSAAKMVARFARVFTPVVMGLALLTVVILPLATDVNYSSSIHRALVFLVIACPGTFLISISATYFAGIAGSIGEGILFRSEAAMDSMAEIKTAVFDKAGTLTSGRFRVASAKSDRMDAEMLLKIAAHTVASSAHDFAKSILFAYRGGIRSELMHDYIEYPEGVKGSVDEIPILVGTRAFMLENGVNPDSDESAEMAVFMAVDGIYAGRLLLSDTIREDSARALREMADLGVERFTVLSSDSRELGAKFAKDIGISEYYSECLPSDKEGYIRKAKEQAGNGTVAFIGSSWNDISLPTAADVDVVMGNPFIDATAKAAPVVIFDDNLATVAAAIREARHTQHVLLQNVLLVVIIKIIILVLAILGISSEMWFAVFADICASLLAILNSFRAFGAK